MIKNAKNKNKMKLALLASTLFISVPAAFADSKPCHGLPSHEELENALKTAVASENSGLNNEMWGTIVNRDGIVCAVAFSGKDRGAQWPGSRVISAQKANTANAFSLDAPKQAVSTANLYAPVQGTSSASAATALGGNFYGLQFSNPVDTEVAYAGNPQHYGQHQDPMIGKRIGGVNVFGGGLGLYKDGKIVGGLGVSGDTSCHDHNISWLVRKNLQLDYMKGVTGFSGDKTRPDNIILDIFNGNGNNATDGFEQAECPNQVDPTNLPPVHQ
jgi:uncharacterized protein GlcG (DUF336 family)